MHGSYKHRITCNLHPHQYHPLVQAARRLNMPKALFLRDAALAYTQKKTVLPTGIDSKLKAIQHEIQSIGMYLNPIIAEADQLQRVTPGNIRRAAKLIRSLNHQLTDLENTLSSIPHDH